MRRTLVGILAVSLAASLLAGCLAIPSRDRYEFPPVPQDASASWTLSQPLEGSGTTVLRRPVFHDPYSGTNEFQGLLRVKSFATRQGTDFLFAELYLESPQGHRTPLAIAGILATDDDVVFQVGHDGKPIAGPVPLQKGEDALDALSGMDFKGGFSGVVEEGTMLALAFAYSVGEGGPDPPVVELEFKAGTPTLGNQTTPEVRQGTAGARLLSRDEGFEGSSLTSRGVAPVTRLDDVTTVVETHNDTLLFVGAAIYRDQKAEANGGNLRLHIADSLSSVDVELGGNTNKSTYSLILLEEGPSKWTFQLNGEGILDFIVAWAEIPAAVPMQQSTVE